MSSSQPTASGDDRLMEDSGTFSSLSAVMSTSGSGQADKMTVASSDPIEAAFAALEQKHRSERDALVETQREQHRRQLDAIRDHLRATGADADALAVFDQLSWDNSEVASTVGTSRLEERSPDCPAEVGQSINEVTIEQDEQPTESLSTNLASSQPVATRNSRMDAFLRELKTKVQRANLLCKEANELLREVWCPASVRVDDDVPLLLGHTSQPELPSSAYSFEYENSQSAIVFGTLMEFSVTLQIPASELRPYHRGATRLFSRLIEPAVLVRVFDKGVAPSAPSALGGTVAGNHTVLSMEDFEARLIDLRELYEEQISRGMVAHPLQNIEPFSAGQHSNGQQRQTNAANPFADLIDLSRSLQLVGVANVFLRCLFGTRVLSYHVPIINQQGEVAGRLHISLQCVSAPLSTDFCAAIGDADDEDDELCDHDEIDVADDMPISSIGATPRNLFKCRFSIKSVRGLATGHYGDQVLCKYQWWSDPCPVTVTPAAGATVSPVRVTTGSGVVTRYTPVFRFEHTRDLTAPVCDSFIDYCDEQALSIEVYANRPKASVENGRGDPGKGGQRSQSTSSIGSGRGRSDTWADRHFDLVAKSHNVADRWTDVCRQLEMWVEVLELNEQGRFRPVPVENVLDVPTGGVYQLRQGFSRRIRITLSLPDAGRLNSSSSSTPAAGHPMPVTLHGISDTSLGAIIVRSKLQRGLDSYQEEELGKLREKWTSYLDTRKQYLDKELAALSANNERNARTVERENALMEQYILMTEERNAVLVPQQGSGIPGAPADWSPPLGMELHVPLIFMDLFNDDRSETKKTNGFDSASDDESTTVSVEQLDESFRPPNETAFQKQQQQEEQYAPLAGEDAILPKERNAAFLSLSILSHACSSNNGDGSDDEENSDDDSVFGSFVGKTNRIGVTTGHSASRISVTLAWDSSQHEAPCLNRVTGSSERVYAIVRAVARLRAPLPVDVVLRKRIALHVAAPNRSRGLSQLGQHFGQQLRKFGSAIAASSGVGTGVVGDVGQTVVPLVNGGGNDGSGTVGHNTTRPTTATGVTFELVSNIPKSSEDLEGRDALAARAAAFAHSLAQDCSKVDKLVTSNGSSETCPAATSDTEPPGGSTAVQDGAAHIENYMRTLSTVNELLEMDRIRQELAVAPPAQIAAPIAIGAPNATSGQLRKTFSVPNFSQSAVRGAPTATSMANRPGNGPPPATSTGAHSNLSSRRANASSRVGRQTLRHSRTTGSVSDLLKGPPAGWAGGPAGSSCRRPPGVSAADSASPATSSITGAGSTTVQTNALANKSLSVLLEEDGK